ncbi:tetratricopeptide repeat protein [Prolixibacteraceae bacterium JC049]|nr:tetratricopeptide repeat protein [Prolixibacteraceae bacterium JC049]
MISNIQRASFILLIVFLAACSADRQFKAGNTAYEIGEYTKAIDRYKTAYKETKNLSEKRDMAFNLAESYRKLGQYQRSVIWYRNAIRRGHPNKMAALYYADALKASGKLKDAIEAYQVVLDSMPDNVQALNGKYSCEMIPEWKKNQTRFIVNNVRQLNSNQSDYGVAFNGKDNEIIFTSTRDASTNKRKSNITGQKYADLYISSFQIQRQKWGAPKLLDEEMVINTGDEDGAPSITESGDAMYFTRCRYDKSKDNGAQIYKVNQSRGEWSDPEMISISSDSLMTAHPAISADGDVIYFVSDMDGGQGGKDIWKSEKSGSGWSKPENLGAPINTPGDEMFPFIHANGDLYFASNYHPGLGGLDIFKASKDDDDKMQIQNLGVPVNSAGDDFGMVFFKETNKGFFTSNRKGSRGDDIYSFILPPKVYQVLGEVFNKETDQRERDATVRIIGTDGTMLKMKSKDGKFRMELKEDVEYIFAAFKKDFLNAKATANTIGLEDSKDFPVKLYITPTDAPIKVDNINYAFGKWELLQESQSALDSLVSVLEQNPTITIELMSHTDFVGSEQFNRDLSQKRALSVVNYLIAKGIAQDRLVAKGYGESWPKKVNRKLAREYDFLRRGDVLNEAFISELETEEQKETCKAINRRTEFKVLSTDYHEKFDPEPEK